jgi:hypothetical protein
VEKKYVAPAGKRTPAFKLTVRRYTDWANPAPEIIVSTVHNSSILHYLLTYSWRWALLEKLPIVQPLKNFPAFYGTRRFITALTRALHWSLSWAKSIQSPPSHPVLRSILILSAHLRIGLPGGPFLLAFPSVSFKHSSSPHSSYMPCPSHPAWLDHSNYTWGRVQVMKLLIMQPPVT